MGKKTKFRVEHRDKRYKIHKIGRTEDFSRVDGDISKG